MKRTGKQLFALLLLTALVLNLSGCGAFQTQMAKTTTRMARLQNFRMELDCRLKGEAEIGLQTVPVDTGISGILDVETDPLVLRSDLSLRAFGGSWPLRYYITKEYDTISLIPWGEDAPVRRSTLTLQEAKRSKTTQALKLLVRCGDSFAEPADDTVDGAPAKRYDGSLPMELVDEALILLNLKKPEPDETETSGEIPASEKTDGLPPAMESAVPTESPVPEEAAGDAGNDETSGIPCSIWVDGEDYIVRVELDLTDVLGSISEELLEKLLSDYDLGNLQLSLHPESFLCRVTLSRFDSLERLVLPE